MRNVTAKLAAKQTAKLKHKRPPAGYTLIEMVVASASAVVLMGGLSSALYIGAQSLDVNTGSRTETRTANAALATIKRDLEVAVSISELTATSVTMTVPDRDNDAVAETIRYAWTGSAGDPLTQSYNGATATTLAADVQSFSLDWLQRLIEGVSTKPFVLFVSEEARQYTDGTTVASAAEQDRIDKIEAWGFQVTTISQEATQAEFDAQLVLSNVVYVSGETDGATIGSKLNGTTLGVVTESFANADFLGFYSSLSTEIDNNSTIDITNDHHYITTGYTPGGLWILSTDQTLKWTNSLLTTSAVTLTKSFGSAVTGPSLLILDAGDVLADGSMAPGRRCQLPWGEDSFDSTEFRPEGQTLMRRSIEWAAGAGEDTATPWITYHEFTEKQLSSDKKLITIDTPLNYAEGDLLIAAVATDGDTESSISAPAGWNEILATTDNAGKVTLGVWWKLATASEPTAVQFDWSDNQRAYGWIMRFTGHDPANPIPTSASNTGASNSPTAPALTAPVDDCLILRIGSYDHDNILPGDAGMVGHTTIAANESDNGGGSVSGAAAYQMQAYAGTSGVATFGLSGKEEYRTVTIAIAPDTNP